MMPKIKLFSKDEKNAIALVLDMGFSIHNSNEDLLKSNFGEIIIENSDWSEKEYISLSNALTVFIKRENDYHNGF